MAAEGPSVPCSCCGVARPGEMVALQCHAEVVICPVCIRWLLQRAGGCDATPIFPVADMGATTRFYEDAGFVVAAYDQGFAFVRRGDVDILNLALTDGLDPAANAAGCYLDTDEVERWHEEWRAAGLDVSALVNEPWGMREFQVIDPSGNRVRVGHGIDDD